MRGPLIESHSATMVVTASVAWSGVPVSKASFICSSALPGILTRFHISPSTSVMRLGQALEKKMPGMSPARLFSLAPSH